MNNLAAIEAEIAAHQKAIRKLEESKAEIEASLKAVFETFGDNNDIAEPLRAPVERVLADTKAEIATHQKAVDELIEAEVIAKLARAFQNDGT